MAENATEALATGAATEGAPKPVSITDELTKVRQALTEDRKPKLFELPGYGRRLMAKYKVVGYDEANDIGDKVGEQLRAEQITDPVLAGLSDTLVEACVGFYRGVDANGEPLPDDQAIPLEKAENLDGGPIKWGDARLWEMLSLEAVPGETLRVRAAMRQILGGDKMLIVEHAQDVTRWMERARRNINTDF